MTDTPVFDRDTALAALGGDLETWEIVVETFLETTPELLEQVRNALAQSQLETLGRHAHSLKSSSRTVGGMALGEKAAELEKACGESQSVLLGPLVDAVIDGFKELKIHLDGSSK